VEEQRSVFGISLPLIEVVWYGYISQYSIKMGKSFCFSVWIGEGEHRKRRKKDRRKLGYRHKIIKRKNGK
jgi:hypothetical protein